ncbi:SDR family oxidoreductase [Acidisoma cellulosilytica]|uniref:SDR family oxidoreductase n=1 Tax=Acidisoma cellulosilyticum TaxID=2802395 RepID=A0A963Z410_9PROT|nr:SDR family oxidoreductase [Acidisoma cellulosilyticum]MCB8882056.1 SDR family oxidoreductase [Acidisoma cellulosilyticum]
MTSEGKGGAIVTGAARGIGRQIAAGLVADGYGVVIADVDETTGQATAEALTQAGGGAAVFAKVDVTDRASIQDAIGVCVKRFGSLKVMINNAGYNKPEPFLDITEKTWRGILEVNALGVLIGIQEAGKAMIAAGTKGKIINTASIAGRTGFPDFAPYCVSKAAVISLTQSAARALASKGITVNAFAPGVVATPLWEQLDKDLYAMGASTAPGEAMGSMANQILLGRVADPKDVVGTVKFLWSEQSDYMTGQVLVIDGGMVLQ